MGGHRKPGLLTRSAAAPGPGFTVYMRLKRWFEQGVPKCTFTKLQRDENRAEPAPARVNLDSTMIKAHQDGNRTTQQVASAGALRRELDDQAACDRGRRPAAPGDGLESRRRRRGGAWSESGRAALPRQTRAVSPSSMHSPPTRRWVRSPSHLRRSPTRADDPRLPSTSSVFHQWKTGNTRLVDTNEAPFRTLEQAFRSTAHCLLINGLDRSHAELIDFSSLEQTYC